MAKGHARNGNEAALGESELSVLAQRLHRATPI